MNIFFNSRGAIAYLKHKAWNKGKAVGQKKPFSPDEVKAIKRVLNQKARLRDLVLFSVGLDTMLRSCDLLCLEALDVRTSTGKIRSEIPIIQKKRSSVIL